MIYYEDCSSYDCGCPDRKEIELPRQHVTLLRDAILKRMSSENRWPDYIIEALAATDPKQ